MANWLTIKQLSEKRDIAESTLRNWINLGYITSSTIDNVIMLDDDSLISYLDTHQTKGLNKESLEKLIKEKKMECEIILSHLDDELFLLKTQSPVSYTHLDVYKRQVQRNTFRIQKTIHITVPRTDSLFQCIDCNAVAHPFIHRLKARCV